MVYRFNSVTCFAASQLLKNFVDRNFERKLVLHRNLRAAGSIPARGPIVAFLATATAWLSLINVKNLHSKFLSSKPFYIEFYRVQTPKILIFTHKILLDFFPFYFTGRHDAQEFNCSRGFVLPSYAALACWNQ